MNVRITPFDKRVEAPCSPAQARFIVMEFFIYFDLLADPVSSRRDFGVSERLPISFSPYGYSTF